MNYVNEITLNYKRRTLDLGTITKPHDAFKVATSIYHKSNANLDLKEYFFAIFLNCAGDVIGYKKISEGGITGTVVDKRLIFAPALKALANRITLVHNHPSGQLEPSEADIRLTKELCLSGKLLDIPVLDHLIITSDGYFSFGREGLL